MAYQPKSYRKLFASAATASMVASVVAPVANAAEVSDIDGHRHEEAILALIDQEIISGYPDGTFRPDQEITRGEGAILIARALGLLDGKDIPKPSFTDVKEGMKAYEAIAKLEAKGIISGFTDGTYRPDAPITREAIAKYLVLGFEKKFEEADGEGTPFTDVSGSSSLGKYVEALYNAGVTSGVAADKFGSKQNMKRGDFAAFTYRTINLEDINVEPMVESVSAINLKQVKVVFNKDVDVTTAESTANYTFAASSGLTVSAAKASGKEVVLTLGGTAAQQQTADLTIENVKTTKGEVIGKTTKEVKFLDVVAPSVSSIEAIGPKTIKVKFSELLNTVPTFTLNDGTISIVNVAFTSGSDEATLTLGTEPTAGTHKLKVKDGADFAGFKVEEVVKEFTFAKDTVAPTMTVKSASPTKIVLEFNEEVQNVADANVEFYHTYKGVAAYKATKSVNGKELTLNFSNPLPEGAFKLYLEYADDKGAQIQDLWGNKVAEQVIQGTVVTDTTAPTVTKVEAKTNTAIEVTFSEAVTGATTAANYEIKDAAGNTVAINGSITNVSGNTYSIPVAPLNGGTYTLTIKNIKDTSINQNKLADYTTTVSVKDVVAPKISDLDSVANGTQAQLLSSKKVKIVFDEVMDKASIENKLNYLFGGSSLDSKVKLTAVDGNKAVILDFTDVASGAQTTPAGATLQVLRVTDAAGNPITAPSTDVLVPASVSAPLFDKAEATGKNTIKLYFKEVITGAQADDFEVNVNGAGYKAAGAVSNEVVDGKSVITLTTADAISTDVTNVLVRTAATNVDAKNSYGAAVSLSGVSVADKYAPEMTAVVAKETDGDNFVDEFVVTFSENLYVPSVNDSDFTIEGYTIKSVAVNNNEVTLTVEEKKVNDLNATPKVTLVSSVEDTARNAKSSQDGINATSDAVASVAAAKSSLAITYAGGDSASNVTQNLTLPTSLNGTTISWASDNTSVVANDGTVTRPASGQPSATVTLTATIQKGSTTDTKTFTVTVIAQP